MNTKYNFRLYVSFAQIEASYRTRYLTSVFKYSNVNRLFLSYLHDLKIHKIRTKTK